MHDASKYARSLKWNCSPDERAGGWFESSRDGFGRLCGLSGLHLGVSIQVIRHIVSTAAVHQNIPSEDRADLEAANLHTLEVAERYYVSPLVASSAAVGSADAGRFARGLGKRTFLFPISPLLAPDFTCCA
jgi:hypothetical protein